MPIPSVTFTYESTGPQETHIIYQILSRVGQEFMDMNKGGTLSVMEKNQEGIRTGGAFFALIFGAFYNAD